MKSKKFSFFLLLMALIILAGGLLFIRQSYTQPGNTGDIAATAIHNLDMQRAR